MSIIIDISHDERLFRSWHIAFHHFDELANFGHVKQTVSVDVRLVEHPHEEFFHVLIVIVVIVSFVLIVSFIFIVSFVVFMMVIVVGVHACPQFIPGEVAVIV